VCGFGRMTPGEVGGTSAGAGVQATRTGGGTAAAGQHRGSLPTEERVNATWRCHARGRAISEGFAAGALWAVPESRG
jgi:hypothetical protein